MPARPFPALVAVTAAGLVLLASCSGGGESASGRSTSGTDAKRDVLLVGNNWDGTADVIDVRSRRNIHRINVIPDQAERMAEITAAPDRLAFFLAIQQQIGEGHNQYVDDMFASNDGRRIFVSRPSFADVIALDLASGQIVWRTPVSGYRSDHMALSPDGTRLAVSASTGNVVHLIDTASGQIVGEFPSGDSPHENNYTRDGTLILHAAIGRVYTPTDDPVFGPVVDLSKGERRFQIVDARTLAIVRQIDLRQKLDDFGRPDISETMRPMALSPDEKVLYFQTSFFHGFVEYDLVADRVTRVAELPLSGAAQQLRRDEYILDSAHHGIAMSGDGRKLCIAGTMSNYAAIVHRDDFSHRIHPLGARTYWATTSDDGQYCYVSVAGDDTLSILSYETEEEVARIPVGDHPQRARTARLAEAVVAGW